jgi:adenylate kinase
MSKRKAPANEPEAGVSNDEIAMDKRLPNILITGTPGTGKTTTTEMLLVAVPGLHHINVGALVKEKNLHDGWDEEWQSYILDEDKVCDEIEGDMLQGGRIVDHHGCDFFPEDWFDLIVVLRADNSVLGKRLEDRWNLQAKGDHNVPKLTCPGSTAFRGYSERKISENIEAEIMQVVLEEARESYAEEKVLELESNSLQDMERNITTLREWVASWKPTKRIKARAPVSSDDDDDEELV